MSYRNIAGMTPAEMVKRFPHLKDGSIMENCLQDIVCPNCGGRFEIHITGTISCPMSDSGPSYEGDFEYDGMSFCRCSGCSHMTTVDSFTCEGLDEHLKQIAKDEPDELPPCPMCGGPLGPEAMGELGNFTYFRCRQCGHDHGVED